jgi:hypothetical protein
MACPVTVHVATQTAEITLKRDRGQILKTEAGAIQTDVEDWGRFFQ